MAYDFKFSHTFMYIFEHIHSSTVDNIIYDCYKFIMYVKCL